MIQVHKLIFLLGLGLMLDYNLFQLAIDKRSGHCSGLFIQLFVNSKEKTVPLGQSFLVHHYD